MKRFAGKVALVTGAGRGIGRGIALRLASEGAHVIVNDRTLSNDATAVAETIRGYGQQALVAPADVGIRAEVEAMFARAVAHFGRIDIVVPNAALSLRQPVLDQPWADALRTLEVCEFGVFHACQLGAQQMVRQAKDGKGGGKIVIIGSVHYDAALADSAAYNMAKAAVNHLARTLAVELAPHRININVVNPGWIDTPGERNFATEEELQVSAQSIPWKRLGTPEDIANAVAFLASAEADYITGATLRVDGGFVPGMVLPEVA